MAGVLGGGLAFAVGVILLPLVKWIHDVQSRAVDAERNVAQTYMPRTQAETALAGCEDRLQRQIADFRALVTAEHQQMRHAIEAVHQDFKAHDQLDIQRHRDLKEDLERLLSLRAWRVDHDGAHPRD